MTPDDIPRLAGLIRSITAFSTEEIDCAVELVQIARDPRNPDYRVLVADAGPSEPLLGYACFGPTPLTRGTFDLYWIASAPAARGAGVGRALHEAVVRAAGLAGGRLLRVETSAKDAYGGTRRFYERTGYRQVGLIEDFYDVGDHLVVLACRIDAGNRGP